MCIQEEGNTRLRIEAVKTFVYLVFISLITYVTELYIGKQAPFRGKLPSEFAVARRFFFGVESFVAITIAIHKRRFFCP